MTNEQKQIAHQCLRGAENDEMTFPEIVGALTEAGFEGYAVDFRRGAATYYMPDGTLADLDTSHEEDGIAAAFDIDAIRGAIAEAQQLVPGYTYLGFCRKVMEAGCAGYIVSISGRRALYYGRTGDTHAELFPGVS